MPARSVRRALTAAASLSLVVVMSASTWAAGAGGREADDRAFVAISLARVSASSGGASVDPRVSRELARDGRAEALLVLNGDAHLLRASASADGESRAFLRAAVPAYAELKDDVRARVPRLEVVRDYRTLPILHVTVPSRAVLERAAADPAVVGVAANGVQRAFLTQSLPLINQPDAAAAGHTGAGTAVAVLDSGVDHTRAAFGDCSGGPGTGSCKVVASEDFAPPDGELDDAILHGTNVAGIVVGVAPETKILALDVFDGNGARDADILDAIDFTIANQATFDVRALNMSLGTRGTFRTSPCGGGTNPYVSAFANARAAGILPVVASGNDAFFDGQFHVGIAQPACTPGAVSVGAVYDSDVGGRSWGQSPDVCSDSTTAADQVPCFSQTASFLSLVAPGALLRAADVLQGGTSQASPHVAGAVAVLVDSSPSATTDQVEFALETTGPLVFDPLIDQEFHRLDLPAAIAAVSSAPTPSPTPSPPPTGECTIEGNNRSNFLLGTSGDDVICGNGGDDILVPSGGTDTVIGGTGFDFVSFEDADSGANVDLGARTATAGSNVVTLRQIEGAIGSPFADGLFGSGSRNDLVGLAGSDLIDGGGGFDFARFDFATRPIRASLADGSARGEGTDRLVRVEGFVGGSASDELVGSGAGNVMFGLDGNDALSGLAKADTLFGDAGSDSLFGGRGDDDLFGGIGADVCDQQGGSGTVSSC